MGNLITRSLTLRGFTVGGSFDLMRGGNIGKMVVAI